jgi:hypothetical protein
MICPNDGSKDFDDLDCRDCKWYIQCFKMWQNGNIFGKEELGDNFPVYETGKSEPIKHIKKENQNPITKEEIDKFKIELGKIIFYSDWEKKINAS